MGGGGGVHVPDVHSDMQCSIIVGTFLETVHGQVDGFTVNIFIGLDITVFMLIERKLKK